jgi:hypothetical protein
MSNIKNGLAAALLVSLCAGALAGCANAPDADAEDASEDVGSAGEAVLSASSNQAFGWVWSSLTTPGTVNASSGYSYNSAGGTNTITNTGTGTYRVDFPSMAGAGGNVQVVAYGATSDRCKVQSWGNNGSTLNVYVRCFTIGGALVSTPFVVYYGRELNVSGGAYLWNNQASYAQNTSYTPATSYQYTAGNAYSTIVRLDTGTYRVTVPGLSYYGNVQVTAYGTGAEMCKVAGWTQSGSDTLVDVRCFGALGVSADSQFTMFFHKGTPSTGYTGGYALANDPVSASYTPPAGLTALFNSSGSCYSGPWISAGHRAGTGAYFVKYPQEGALFSTALATAYGYGNEYCKVAGWWQSGPDTEVDVQCYDYLGNPVDTKFSSEYFGTESITPC